MPSISEKLQFQSLALFATTIRCEIAITVGLYAINELNKKKKKRKQLFAASDGTWWGRGIRALERDGIPSPAL